MKSTLDMSNAIEELAGRVFVSPRVVDQRTFDELSMAMKGLLKEAAGQGRVLVNGVAEVKGLSEHVKSDAKELQAKCDAVSRVVQGADQRIAKLESVLSVVSADVAARIEALKAAAAVDHRAVAAQAAEQAREAVRGVIDGVVEQVVREGVLKIQQRGEEAARGLEERLGGIVQRASERVEVLERVHREWEEKIEGARGRCEEQVGNLEGRLRGLVAEASEVERQMQEKLHSASEQVERAQEKLGETGRAISEVLSRGLVDVESRVAGLRAQVEEVSGVSEMLDIAQARATVVDLNDAIGRATEQALELREVAARVRAGEDVGGGEGVEKLKGLLEEAHRVGPRLAELVARAKMGGA